ncbi:MAG: hypothetical protein AAFN07_04575 [Pseudomonadota bacterium]
MSKFRAVAVHFAISLSIVSIVFFVIFTQWYPPPYFQINGAQNVLKTLIGVDLVLGPLLTAILYRPNKPGLKFDMSFIAVVQLTALIFGTGVLYQERPRYLIFAVDRYTVLPARDVVFEAGEESISACEGVPANPCAAVALVPTEPAARDELMVQVLESGIDIERRPAHWVSLPNGKSAVIERARPLSDLTELDPSFASVVTRLQARHEDARDDLLLVPVVNKRLEAMLAVVDGRSAALVDVVDAEPWALFARPARPSQEQAPESVGTAG